MFNFRFAPRALLALVLWAVSADAAILFDNGPVITNPTGGTGSIAGQPISQPERLPRPGDGALVQTPPGRNNRAPAGHSIADDFTVPAGGWDLDTATIIAFESITGSMPSFTSSIDRIHLNVWTAAPFSANSPPPVPSPLPQPVLANKLILPVLSSEFVGFRTASSTATASFSRTLFALTVSLDDLPDAGRLVPGSYWLEWALEDLQNATASVQVPLVTPRTTAPDINARQFNYIGFGPIENSWFEPRDGFVAGVSDGLAMSFPFSLGGTAIPEPNVVFGTSAVLAGLIARRRAFVLCPPCN